MQNETEPLNFTKIAGTIYIFLFRTKDDAEIDLIIEWPDHSLTLVEIK